MSSDPLSDLPVAAPPAVLSLGDGYWDAVAPADFPQQILRFRNQRAAEEVGLSSLTEDQWLAHMARFQPLPGNLPQPLALRYHGHQFTHYNPQLGDGRGFLYAQLSAPVPAAPSPVAPLYRPNVARLLDLGTKGSGTTPWSRGGDGRLTLKGGFREILAAELLQALGVPTCRILSVVETGEELDRHDEPSPTRACVLVRLNHSHVRYGTFQRLAYFRDAPRLDRLTSYVLQHLHASFPSPEALTGLPAATLTSPAARLLATTVALAADTAAAWMVAGFVHGVLNTDNMNVTGESFDYGPWRFLPTFDNDFVAAYFDHSGLYAYGRQPGMVEWNLHQLALALTAGPGLAPSDAAPILAAYRPTYARRFAARTLWRLGLQPQNPDADAALAAAFYKLLSSSQVGFDQAFFDWYGGPLSEARAAVCPSAPRYTGPDFQAFYRLLMAYTPALSPADASAVLHAEPFQHERPPSMLITELESLWTRVADHGEWSRLHATVERFRTFGALLARVPVPPIAPG